MGSTVLYRTTSVGNSARSLLLQSTAVAEDIYPRPHPFTSDHLDPMRGILWVGPQYLCITMITPSYQDSVFGTGVGEQGKIVIYQTKG